jgi:glycosyltransferase involved in cell wall biosynthesis
VKISIVLPCHLYQPIGGYRVHFTYANELSRRGHNVSLIFPLDLSTGPRSWSERKKAIVRTVKTWVDPRSPFAHFKLYRGVTILFVPNLDPSSLPKADILVATGWQTAELLVHALPKHGRKFYVVYDYEFWRTVDATTKARIEATFTDDFAVVSTSDAVDEMLGHCGVTARMQIPCGIDFTAFGCDVPIADRTPLMIGFAARSELFKGTQDAVAAVEILRQIYGDRLQVAAFGSPSIKLPDWIRRIDSPTPAELRLFYNSLSVFLAPSHFEGWGLPACEAMVCGTALVSTDNGGSRNYAFDRQTALVVPPGSPEALARASDVLFQDDGLRRDLAAQGREFVQRFQWKNAVDKMENLFHASP